MSELTKPWRPAEEPPMSHDEAMDMLIACAREAGMSYEEAICGYLRARGLLNDGAAYACEPMPEGWEPLAALSRRPDAPSAGDWESIETAPKDGTRVLMWGSGWDAPTAWEWVSEAAAEQELSNWTDPPTHWMPLPAPPQADGGEG